MRIYFDYEREKLLTEQEAKRYVEEGLLDDDYSIWEFIIDSYPYEKIMENLPQSFLNEVTEELIKERLEDADYFLVREFPD